MIMIMIMAMGAEEGLDGGVAPGSGGAEAAPASSFELPEMSQFCVRLQMYVCQLRHFETVA